MYLIFAVPQNIILSPSKSPSKSMVVHSFLCLFLIMNAIAASTNQISSEQIAYYFIGWDKALGLLFNQIVWGSPKGYRQCVDGQISRVEKEMKGAKLAMKRSKKTWWDWKQSHYMLSLIFKDLLVYKIECPSNLFKRTSPFFPWNCIFLLCKPFSTRNGDGHKCKPVSLSFVRDKR